MPVLSCPKQHEVLVAIDEVLVAICGNRAVMVFACPDHGEVARMIGVHTAERAIAMGARQMLPQHPECITERATTPLTARIVEVLTTSYLGDDPFAQVAFARAFAVLAREVSDA